MECFLVIDSSLIENSYPLPTFTPVSRRRAYEALAHYLSKMREWNIPKEKSIYDSLQTPNSEILSVLDTVFNGHNQ